MNVTVETGEGLNRQMTVELPPDEIEQAVDKRLREVARSATLPGFRPGKVPMRVLRSRFGDSVISEVFGDLVQSSFTKAVEQEALRPAAMPEIEPDIDKATKRYAYIAKFEVLPQLELNSLAGHVIKRPAAQVEEADLEKMITRLREQRKVWTPVDRPAADGDAMTLSYQGSIDGEDFAGGRADDSRIELGTGRMIPGFEEKLAGLSSGADTSIEVSFPDDYHAKELAGKTATFAVQVKEVAESGLPEVDADFAKAFGVADGDIDKFLADVRGNMERELKQRLEAKVKEQVMDALIKAHPLDIPNSLVREEIGALKEQMRRNAGGSNLELPDDLFTESAKRRVALGLIIGELAKKHELKPGAERVRAAVEEMASTYEQPQEVVDYYYADPQRLAPVESMVLEEIVVEHALAEADVVDEPSSFDAVTENSGMQTRDGA